MPVSIELSMQLYDTVTLSLAELEGLAFTALLRAGTEETNARSVAASIAAAEADGLHSHGLMRLPSYCEHVCCGKVDGQAKPKVVRELPAATTVDACTGFAHPAIDLGFRHLVPAAKRNGIAALAVTNSYNCGVVGHHVERLAVEGCVALAHVNAPAAIAPWGGKKPFFGTNPIALAAPRRTGPPIVIDQSASVVARGEVMLHARQGKAIPEGWALDADGRATTDPNAALAGSMMPAGGYKGSNLALIVEVFAALLTGAQFSSKASSFADNHGGPPRTGQFFIAVDAAAMADGVFFDRIEALIESMCSEPDVALPGARRIANRSRTATQGIVVARKIYEDIVDRAGRRS